MTEYGNIQPLYRSALLVYAMNAKGWDARLASEAAGIHPDTVNAALAGQLGTLKRLKRLADSLGVSWKHLFDLDLPESRFRQAVTNGKRD